MSRFATLDSLKKKGREEEEDDDDKRNEYYAGGASRNGGSGLSVVGPRDEEEADDIQKILNRAMRDSQAGSNGLREGEEFVTLTIYRNGFTVDNGPFRAYGVPENEEFMRYVSEGRSPPELIRNNKPASLKLENRRDEDYTPPAYVAFGGGGMRVGRGPELKEANTVISPVSGADLPEVNEKEPTIRVQIIFPDRSRIVAKFNKHHTVHDLISVIHHSNKVNSQFILLGPAPPKPIEASEFTKTITAAGLANASVTVSTNI